MIKAHPLFFMDCPTDDSTYQENLNTLISVLASNSNVSTVFFLISPPVVAPDVAYGLFLCRGDVSAAVCRDCITSVTKYAVEKCPASKRVTIWREKCMLRYSNESTLPGPAGYWGFMRTNTLNLTGTRFNEILENVISLTY